MFEDRQVDYGPGALITQSMINSEISNNCVEGYQKLFAALEDELLEVEHFFAEPICDDVVNGVQSFDTFSLQKCLNVAAGGASTSNLLEGEIAKDGPLAQLLAGTSEQTAEGLPNAAESLPDICKEYLLDPENDDTDISYIENVDSNNHSAGGKELVPTSNEACSTGEPNLLAGVFKFRTKPRGRNVRPVSFDHLKAFSSEISKLKFGLSDMRERSSAIVTKKRLPKRSQRFTGKPSKYKIKNRRIKYGSPDPSAAEVQDDTSEDDCDAGIKTQKSKIGRTKKHKSWSIPEVLKLVEGVSKHGVGNWTVIKRWLFPSAARTSVDLKDKWRNLLRAASCKRGKSARHNASRAIPHHILSRVSELAVIHPYPRQHRLAAPQTVPSDSSMSDLSIFDDILPLSITLLDYS